MAWLGSSSGHHGAEGAPQPHDLIGIILYYGCLEWLDA